MWYMIASAYSESDYLIEAKEYFEKNDHHHCGGDAHACNAPAVGAHPERVHKGGDA